MTTRVFARIKSKPDHTEAVRAVLLELVTASRTEPGVIFYELFETREGGEFLVNEEYHDAAAFDAHLASPHFTAAGAKLQDLLAAPVDIWNTVPREPQP